MTTKKAPRAQAQPEPPESPVDEPLGPSIEPNDSDTPPTEMETWQAEAQAQAAAVEEAEPAKAPTWGDTPKPTPRKKGRVVWRETRWGTHPHYDCTACHFSTFDLAAMEAHVAKKH